MPMPSHGNAPRAIVLRCTRRFARVVKAFLTTVERKLVLKRLGRLQASDEKALRRAIESIIG